MMRLLPIPLLALVCLPGCARGDRAHSNCEWPHETAIPLDLSKPAQQRHLNDDAEVAEDVAIRYADLRSGPHSGHFTGFGEYARTRDRCMAALFQAIANNHSVPREQVRESLGHRRASLDLAVILSFAVLYGFAASVMARRIWRRFPVDEGWMAGAVVILFASAVFSAGGVLAGEQWSIAMENFRLGTGHLSYRIQRIPWVQHPRGFFIAGVVLFWLIAGLHSRTSARGAERLPPQE